MIADDVSSFDAEQGYLYLKEIKNDCVLSKISEDEREKVVSNILSLFNYGFYKDYDKYMECLEIAVPLLMEVNEYINIYNLLFPLKERLSNTLLFLYVYSLLQDKWKCMCIKKNSKEFVGMYVKLSCEQQNKIFDSAKQLGIVLPEPQYPITEREYTAEDEDKSDKILILGISNLRHEQLNEMIKIFGIKQELFEVIFNEDEIRRYTANTLENIVKKYKKVILGPMPDDIDTSNVDKLENCIVCEKLEISDFKKAIKKLF